MPFFQKYKKILTVLLVVIVLFVLYNIFLKGEPDVPLTVETPSGLPPEAGGDIISLLLELRSIELNDAIFSDPTFLSLENFGVELAPEPIGRRNPFAPIGTALLPRTPLPPSATTTTPSPQ